MTRRRSDGHGGFWNGQERENTMDRQLRNEVREEARAAMEAAAKAVMTQMEERWISGPELCKQFQMFSPKWLKFYGDILPRRRVTVTGIDGVSHSSHWAYPQHEIAIGIAEGRYDDLRVLR